VSARLGIDIGGTFTDFALLRDGEIVLEKTLSTPADRSLAVMEGIDKLAAREGTETGRFLAGLDAIVHGTTVADNTLIEMNGARTGLLTTAGFRDELELRRGYKEDIWDVRLEAPHAIVPRRRRLTVPERVLHDGGVHLPLDESAARQAIRSLGAQQVEAIAVCTLFSFVNPAHEARLAELIQEELGGEVLVSISHQVMPKAPEFERTSTTVLNAYVGPRVNAYLDRLVERLREAGYQRRLGVLQSSGGVMTREYVNETPVRVLASGPAGGVIGGAHVGSAKGEPDLLCVDMGGTSYDVSVVRGGSAPAQPGWNWHHRYVVGLPMISVESLGAGGGSLCHVQAGRLVVGPESAGSDPGPVCYARGGELPTVTDAMLVLGILSEASGLAGGRIPLRTDGVEAAFEKHVGGPLGQSVAAAAFDCWRLVNANMTQAVRRLTAERGTHPADLTLLAYGGNGPVFAAIQAQDLGIERVLVPRASPAFSALGALVARPSIDEERAYLCTTSVAEPDEMARLWNELETRAVSFLEDAGFARRELTARYQANLRYPGQNWSLTVEAANVTDPQGAELADGDLVPALVERFHALHESEYGHRRALEEPELTGVRLQMSAPVDAPRVTSGAASESREPAAASTRRANLGNGFEAVAVHHGPTLRPGDRIASPAIIEETFTTVVVYPGWGARVDEAGDYILERSSA
jgi:N-methylhydantoinase A